MPYNEMLIAPMREDLTRYGLEETRTPADVDRVISQPGTVLMVTNSVCGCAAGKARPGIGMALQHANRPDHTATVFAGGDEAAVAHLRGILSDVPPSSHPSLSSVTASRCTSCIAGILNSATHSKLLSC
jgi:putative YphP/YqiW family bacilliredoxin